MGIRKKYRTKKYRIKRQNFRRLAIARVNNVFHVLALIRNLSNRSNYEYAPTEIDKMFVALRKEVDKSESAFNNITEKFNLHGKG